MAAESAGLNRRRIEALYRQLDGTVRELLTLGESREEICKHLKEKGNRHDSGDWARKCFGDIVAVDGITAEIQTGSVYGSSAPTAPVNRRFYA